MKKISTLALALIAMGSLSMPASAQVTFEPVSSIDASGWYQMRQVKSVQNSAVTSESPKYVFSNETKGYSWFGTSDTQKQDATAFIYIDKGSTDYGIQNINGKWGKSKAEATDTRSGMTISVANAKDKTFTVGNYWDDYKKGIMGGFGSSSAATFQFSKVSDETLAQYDVYTVEINGDITTGSVTSNIDANKGTKTVYPGGSFFFTTGTKLEVSNFTAPDVTNCDKVISIDKENKKVSVTYTYNLTSLVNQAKDAISHTSAGYPLADSESRKNLQNAIDATSNTGDNQTLYTNLQTALEAYKKDKTVKMPEDGKVYVITNVQQDGTCYYLSYSNDDLKINSRGTATAESLDNSAKFVCRVVDGKYVFVNVKDGKFLVWKGSGSGSSNGTNNAKGYIATYGADYANLTVSKNDIYACFNIGGKRSDADGNANFIINKVGTYNAYSMNQLNRTDCTTAFKLEEVSYPNTITFNNVSDVEGVSNLATFSAPFATVVPEGVTAYYVSTADNSKATMKAIEAGKAIPAKAGVILTSTTGDKATMLPATTETAAELTGNKLGNSAGAEKTIAEGDNAYILAKRDNATAFYKGKVDTKLGMNKAYLTLNETGAPEAISMNFGGNVTGINQIVNAEQNNAPVYDLTGRRVVRTVKGGLYIKGGNKFIAR
ncbi:hypothetical protein [Prevotellamassilia timonensis]|uniref:hypothetical protein n=1 Tax=Prevotellamassilia timonensis TaxID=1852370 RepID=UPI00307C35DD